MRTYTAIGLTWLLTRALSLASIAALPHLLDDVDIYRGWLPFFRSGGFPVNDPTWQYPPGASGVLLAPDVLPINYAIAFALLCLAFDLAIMAALVLAHSRRTKSNTRGLWLWALAGVLVGPIMFTRFEIVPTFFAVMCVLLVARPALAGAAAGCGMVIKLWPALLVLSLPRRRTWTGVLWLALTVVTLLVLATVSFDGALSFLGNQRARGLQVESVGAAPYWIYDAFGGKVASALEYGSMQLDMPGTEAVGTLITLAGIALIAVIGWWRLSGRLDRVPAGDVALTLVLILVATSRVYSPQFNVWLIGVAAVATISRQTRMRFVAVIIAGVAIATQIVYPLFPTNLVDGEIWIVAIQTARITGLLVATALAMRAIAGRQRSAHRATADAAATFSESTPPDMGTRTATSDD